jgi:hypothetical protein
MPVTKIQPRPADPRGKQLGVRIPAPVWRQVRNLSLDTGVTAASITAIALSEYLERVGYTPRREA